MATFMRLTSATKPMEPEPEPPEAEGKVEGAPLRTQLKMITSSCLP